MKTKSFFSLLTGLAAGAALGLLFALDKGTETRKRVRAKLDEWERPSPRTWMKMSSRRKTCRKRPESRNRHE